MEYNSKQCIVPDATESQNSRQDQGNDDEYWERYSSDFSYDGDVYDAGCVVYSDDLDGCSLEDFEDYDGLIDSGDNSMDYDDYD